MDEPRAAVLDQSYEMVSVRELVMHPRNPNEGDYGAIFESVETNGFWGALVAQRSTGHVLIGNHRLAVSRDLGIDELPVLWVDVDDEKALRILTADNRTARLGTDKKDVLAEILIELAMSPTALTGTGYDGDDLDAMMLETRDLEKQLRATTSAPEVTITCSKDPDDQRKLVGALIELGHPMTKVTVKCDTVVDQDELAGRLEELGYAVAKKGG